MDGLRNEFVINGRAYKTQGRIFIPETGGPSKFGSTIVSWRSMSLFRLINEGREKHNIPLAKIEYKKKDVLAVKQFLESALDKINSDIKDYKSAGEKWAENI